MTPSAWISVLAILLAPVIAVQVSGWLERMREKRQRRLRVFRTLMSTRAAVLSAQHVQALNMIDVEFYGDKKVVRAWKAYLGHLNQQHGSQDVWNVKQADLFVDLLYKMADSLGYDFDRTSVKNTSYFPQGHGRIEEEQTIIRQGLVDLLSGEKHIPIAFASDADEDEQERLQKLLEDFLSHSRPIRVEVIDNSNEP